MLWVRYIKNKCIVELKLICDELGIALSLVYVHCIMIAEIKYGMYCELNAAMSRIYFPKNTA